MNNEKSPYDEINIFLRKDDEIVGLHCIGEKDKDYEVMELDGTITQRHGFLAEESWGNYYDEDYNIKGRGSFRVFEDIEILAEEFEADGWVRFERVNH